MGLRLENIIRERAKGKQRTSTGGNNPQLNLNSVEADKPFNTDVELAKIAGVGHDTIAKVRVITKEATPEQIESLSRGTKTVNKFS